MTELLSWFVRASFPCKANANHGNAGSFFFSSTEAASAHSRSSGIHQKPIDLH